METHQVNVPKYHFCGVHSWVWLRHFSSISIPVTVSLFRIYCVRSVPEQGVYLETISTPNSGRWLWGHFELGWTWKMRCCQGEWGKVNVWHWSQSPDSELGKDALDCAWDIFAHVLARMHWESVYDVVSPSKSFELVLRLSRHSAQAKFE